MTAAGPNRRTTSRNTLRRRRSARGKERTGGQRFAAPIFAALGDETRLALVRKLAAGTPHSIAQLTSGTRLTRQAVTKHLRVLERAGIVHAARAGRESRFELDPEPMQELKTYIELVSEQWDETLRRLKAYVEK